MLTILSSVIFLVIGYCFGFYVRDLWDKLQSMQQKAARIVKREATPHSTIIEPDLTPAQRVIREQEELLERLNPEQ